MNKLKNSYVEAIILKALNKEISTSYAACKLGVTKQYINKLKRRYLDDGINAFEHGNKGKQRSWKTDENVEKKIIEFYETKYSGFNFRHFHEKLKEKECINISYKTLHSILTKASFKSPKSHKKKRKENLHPSRPRRKCFGELLQIDASLHNWFGNEYPKATLHGAIDDATGTAMGLYFCKEETLDGYYEMMWQILTKYGIPEALYGDNRSIFEYRRMSQKEQTVDNDIHIQFKRMCMQLGIELITTSVSQAKGRIERLWGTLQSRLISELRIKNITTIEKANEYLPEFMADYNKRFAVQPALESSLFVPAPSPKEINFYLSHLYERIVNNGSSFNFKGNKLQLADSKGKTVKIFPKTVIKLYETRDGQVVAVHDGEFYNLKTFEEVEETKKVGRPKWKPGKDHPWRHFNMNPKIKR